jgi:hypothetical protein
VVVVVGAGSGGLGEEEEEREKRGKRREVPLKNSEKRRYSTEKRREGSLNSATRIPGTV